MPRADHLQPHDPPQVVHLTLPGCAECDLPPDRIPAIPTTGDSYRIVQVPTDSAELGVGDVVLALPVGDTLEFAWVLERRCLASCSFVLPERVSRPEFLDRLDQIGVAHREVTPGVLMCNLDSDASANGLLDHLEEHRIAARFCDHVTGHWHDTT